MMEDNTNKIQIEVIRSGGIMAQKLALQHGISMSLIEWKELKALKAEGNGKVKPYPDAFIYTFSFADESVVLQEQQLPAKWKRKLEKYYD